MKRFNANPIILYCFLWQKDESQEFLHFHIIPQGFFSYKTKETLQIIMNIKTYQQKFIFKK